MGIAIGVDTRAQFEARHDRVCEHRTKCAAAKTPRASAKKAKRAGHRCPARLAMQDPP
jgi:hypothetical protein